MQSSTTSKTTEGYNISPSKLEVQATSKSRNDRDDTYLPGQSPKVPLHSWGIHLWPTGPESSFILWSRKSALPIQAQFINHFSLSPEGCQTVISSKLETEGPSQLILPKFRDHFPMEPTYPVSIAHCQAVNTRTITSPVTKRCHNMNSVLWCSCFSSSKLVLRGADLCHHPEKSKLLKYFKCHIL